MVALPSTPIRSRQTYGFERSSLALWHYAKFIENLMLSLGPGLAVSVELLPHRDRLAVLEREE